MDAEQYRHASLDQWSRSAAGWEARRAELERFTRPVSMWLAEAIRPQPGHNVLELAAGPGETGFLAAELIQPGGRLVCSDFAQPMLDVARRRAQQLGLANVDFRAIDAESIDIDAASLDAVLCRFGYMLMADPGTALAETRRVLRPGGRVALAVWDEAERNPWAWRAQAAARRVAALPDPDPDAPGMFALSAPGHLEALLADAGFTEVEREAIDLQLESESFDHWWQSTSDLSAPFADLLSGLDDDLRTELREAIARDFVPFADAGGRLTLPARALVAAATA